MDKSRKKIMSFYQAYSPLPEGEGAAVSEFMSITDAGEGMSKSKPHGTLTQIAKFVNSLSNFTLSRWARGIFARTSTCFAFTFAELMIALVVISILSAILYPTIAQYTPNNNKPLFKSAYKIFNEVMAEIINDTRDGRLVQNDGSPITESALCTRFCNKANVVMPLKSGGTPETSCGLDDDTDSDGVPDSGGACANIQNGKQPNTITTANGMRWRFDTCDTNMNTYYIPDPQNGTSGNGAGRFSVPVFKIVVDVNAANNGLTQSWANKNALVPMDTTFISNCTINKNGKCGVFYFDNSNDATTGIYLSGANLPNYNTNTPAQYNDTNLKIQDTFEIYIDLEGKIRGMSPAAWVNLIEDDKGN